MNKITIKIIGSTYAEMGDSTALTMKKAKQGLVLRLIENNILFGYLGYDTFTITYDSLRLLECNVIQEIVYEVIEHTTYRDTAPNLNDTKHRIGYDWGD